MSSPDVSGLIGSVYDAATGALTWPELAGMMQTAFATSLNDLFLFAGETPQPTVLATAGFADRLLADFFGHYHIIDPWKIAGLRIMKDKLDGRSTLLGPEMIADSLLRETEFYRDFARHGGAFHALCCGVDLGSAGFLAVNIFRPEDAECFSESDRRALQSLQPHFNRAMRLRQLLGGAEIAQSHGQAALDGLSVGVAILNGGLRVVMSNKALERMAAASDGLRLQRLSAKLGAEVILRASHEAEQRVLTALVADVMRGGAGGGMRFSRSASPVPLAALVMPLPARLAPNLLHGSSVAPKSALVLVRDLDARAAPNALWLNTLFGLTEAEADIAVALVNGATAEAIAVARGTSAMTVRKQVRSILEKSGAASLRELTRLFTALPERGP